MTTPPTNLYKRHRFPAEIISHCIWLYFRVCLSYRDVEALMAARGVILTYEAVRYWCRKFGQAYANRLRRRRPRPGDKWHLDEVFLTIKGERHYLWRAVDQDGHIAGYSCPEPSKQASGEAGTPPECRASAAPLFEQPRGELTPADAPA
jgi:putative transposase